MGQTASTESFFDLHVKDGYPVITKIAELTAKFEDLVELEHDWNKVVFVLDFDGVIGRKEIIRGTRLTRVVADFLGSDICREPVIKFIESLQMLLQSKMPTVTTMAFEHIGRTLSPHVSRPIYEPLASNAKAMEAFISMWSMYHSVCHDTIAVEDPSEWQSTIKHFMDLGAKFIVISAGHHSERRLELIKSCFPGDIDIMMAKEPTEPMEKTIDRFHDLTVDYKTLYLRGGMKFDAAFKVYGDGHHYVLMDDSHYAIHECIEQFKLLYNQDLSKYTNIKISAIHYAHEMASISEESLLDEFRLLGAYIDQNARQIVRDFYSWIVEHLSSTDAESIALLAPYFAPV